MSQHFYHQDHARVLSNSLFENASQMFYEKLWKFQ